MVGRLLLSLFVVLLWGCEKRKPPTGHTNGLDAGATSTVDTLRGQPTQPEETLGHKGVHQLEWERHRAESLLKDSSLVEFERGFEAGLDGNWSRAAEIFEGVTRVHPENSKAFYNLGLCYEYMRDYSAAIGALKRAYELHPDSLSRSELQKLELWERELERD